MSNETYIISILVGIVVWYCTRAKDAKKPRLFFYENIKRYFTFCDELLEPVSSNNWAKKFYVLAKKILIADWKTYKQYKKGERKKDEKYQYYVDMFETTKSYIPWHWAIVFINHALKNIDVPSFCESETYYRVKSDFAKYIHEMYIRITEKNDCFQSFVDMFPDEDMREYC